MNIVAPAKTPIAMFLLIDDFGWEVTDSLRNSSHLTPFLNSLVIKFVQSISLYQIQSSMKIKWRILTEN